MPRESDRNLLESTATWLIAGASFLIPLLHSGSIAEPFFLPKALTVVALAVCLGVLSLVSYLASDLRPGLSSPSLWLATGVVFLSAVSVIFAANRGLALWGLLDVAAGVALFWGVARFVRRREQVAVVLAAILASTALVALGSIVQVFVPGAHLFFGGLSILPPSLGGSTLGSPELLAALLILALPVGIGAAALTFGWRRVACGAGLGLICGALMFAGRPEGLLVAGLTVALLVATRILQVLVNGEGWRGLVPHPTGHSLWALLSGLVVLLIVLSVSRWPGLTESSARPIAPLEGVTLLSPTPRDPSSEREAAADGTMALIRLRPMGVGPNNWRHAFLEVAWSRVENSPFTLRHQAVHVGNNFLEVMAETGVLGGLAFLALVTLLLLQAGLAASGALTSWRSVGYVAFNVFGALVFISFLGAPFEEPVPSLIFWIVAGLTQAALWEKSRGQGASRFLWPAERQPVPRRLRRRRPALIFAALMLALIGLVTYAAADRLRGARLNLEAQATFRRGRYEAALQRLAQPALRRSPDPFLRARAGTAYMRLGFPSLAVKEFTDAIAKSPHFLSAYHGRALAYEEMGRYDHSEQDLNRALEIWPENIDTLLARARLNTTRGRLDDAIENYLEIVRADREIAEPYFRLGVIFMRRRRFDEAIEAFRLCGGRDPRYPLLATSLGDALYKKGHLQMALRQYQMAAGQDPTDVDPRLKIANTQHALRQFCQTQKSLEAARDLETDPARREEILDLIDKIAPDCRRQRGS
jgi:tetratricopeptide (TPR) repeat protein